ncbi:MAG: hypothetical protein ACJ8KX_06155, partial [Chthoniobacterales bacterium]
VKELRFAPLETRSLLVRLEDRAASDLDCDPLHIYASYRLYDLTGNSVEIPPSLRTPIHLARAGEDRSISLRVQAPAARGTYDIRLSVVQEGFGWWADLGAPGSVVRMIVE